MPDYTGTKTRRNLWKIITGIGFLAAFVVFIVWASGQAASEDMGEKISNQGLKHIPVGESHPPYNSNPPTSGWHYSEPATWGVYDNELPDEQVIHNLEHGGIWISYKDINEETRLKLKKLAYGYPKSVILSPRVKNDGKISLAAWGRLLKLEALDEIVIEQFIKKYRNKSPEPMAR